MTIASILRTTAFAAALATPALLGTGPAPAQEQLTAPSTTRVIGAPTGHRQPRPGHILPTDKTPAELLEEREMAELNRKLRICRGC